MDAARRPSSMALVRPVSNRLNSESELQFDNASGEKRIGRTARLTHMGLVPSRVSNSNRLFAA